MVDADRLLAILGRVTARLRILRGYAETDREGLLADRVRMGDLKYTFQTAIEACVDAAHHVVADLGLGVPNSNGEAFRLLSGADLLATELATEMASAAGFRNVLVHDYAEVDDPQVVKNLQHLDALQAFVGAMSKLLEE